MKVRHVLQHEFVQLDAGTACFRIRAFQRKKLSLFVAANVLVVLLMVLENGKKYFIAAGYFEFKELNTLLWFVLASLDIKLNDVFKHNSAHVDNFSEK